MAERSKLDPEARRELFRILAERDMPAYPDSARDAGVGYTDYLTGAGAYAKGIKFATDPTTGENYVYTPSRNRQCSIGFHEECSDPDGERCGCPCHQLVKLLEDVAGQAKQAPRPRKARRRG